MGDSRRKLGLVGPNGGSAEPGLHLFWGLSSSSLVDAFLVGSLCRFLGASCLVRPFPLPSGPSLLVWCRIQSSVHSCGVFCMFSSYFRLACLQSTIHQHLLMAFILYLTTVNNNRTLSLCSSSSEGERTKVDATPWMYPAYKLFQAFPRPVNFSSVYHTYHGDW